MNEDLANKLLNACFVDHTYPYEEIRSEGRWFDDCFRIFHNQKTDEYWEVGYITKKKKSPFKKHLCVQYKQVFPKDCTHTYYFPKEFL